VPNNKTDVNIETVQSYLGLLGAEHDVEWSQIHVSTTVFCMHELTLFFPKQQEFHAILVAGGLNWELTWSKQSLDCINTLIHAVRHAANPFCYTDTTFGRRKINARR
jgi:hypothetical protein